MKRQQWYVVVSKHGRYLVPATKKSIRLAKSKGYALIGPFKSQMEAWSKGGYAPYNNPATHLLRKPCEYCKLLQDVYLQAADRKTQRYNLARLKRHIRAFHKNPSTRMRALGRTAHNVAYQLYKHFKSRGVPPFVLNRIPDNIRPTVIELLKYNGVPVQNPRHKRR